MNSTTKIVRLLNGAFLFSSLFLGLSIQAAGKKASCYSIYRELQVQRIGGTERKENSFAGTDTPIVKAFEKEGLFYSDIVKWFDRADRTSTLNIIDTRLAAEKAGKVGKKLIRWLENYATKDKAKEIILPVDWTKKSAEEKANFIFDRENPLSAMTQEANENLFLEEILNYDILRPAKETPSYLTVGNDGGSYEVRSIKGEINRQVYQDQLAEVEGHLDGKVGHQHLIHEWPKEKEVRERIAPQYTELLDAGTWFLFWRQLKRNPGGDEGVESILKHPYLGVYNRDSLEKLEKAVIDGDYTNFKNKYRMIGARNVTGRSDMPGQKEGQGLADFERRSGNKGIKREFLEDLIEARFVSGDFTGLRGIHDYEFDASAPIGKLTEKYLSKADQTVLEEFEKEFKWMKYSDDSRAFNHFRNKITAPLLPWENRIPLDYKLPVLDRARGRFAEGLLDIAKKYLAKKEKVRGPPEQGDLNSKTIDKIERLSFLFSDRVKLDEDFERYLTPIPTKLPSVLVKSTGPIDVNKIDLGIEYSFRFPDPPRHKTTAKAEIRQAADELSKALGGSEVKEETGSGHGHNLSVNYSFTDSEGRKWRVEWDGVTRTYVDGEAINPRKGHIEIPSPKWSPQSTKEVTKLFQTMRNLGKVPRRGAGGAHVNIDLAPLKAMPEKEGARKMVDLINYFESHREMIQFLWQHPFRQSAAMKLNVSPSLRKNLNDFDGNWDDLGKVLYEEKYFNSFETRKPSYAQLNATALMADVIPTEYETTIDIKNPKVPWAPAFGGKGKDRIEFRLFDAPTDEFLAALQIKYVRALLNSSLNQPNKISNEPIYQPSDFEMWKKEPAKFLEAAKSHLKEMGLNPEEFQALFASSYYAQTVEPNAKAPLVEFKNFLPAVKR